MRVYDVYDPEGLGGEGGVACLGEELLIGPEEVEDGIEVGEGIGDLVRYFEGKVGG